MRAKEFLIFTLNFVLNNLEHARLSFQSFLKNIFPPKKAYFSKLRIFSVLWLYTLKWGRWKIIAAFKSSISAYTWLVLVKMKLYLKPGTEVCFFCLPIHTYIGQLGKTWNNWQSSTSELHLRTLLGDTDTHSIMHRTCAHGIACGMGMAELDSGCKCVCITWYFLSACKCTKLSSELGVFGGLIILVCSYILSESILCHSTVIWGFGYRHDSSEKRIFLFMHVNLLASWSEPT